MNETEAFFRELAPALIANLLTVAMVYSFAQYIRREHGRGHLLWLICLPMFLALYGLYLWGAYPFSSRLPDQRQLTAPSQTSSCAPSLSGSGRYEL